MRSAVVPKIGMRRIEQMNLLLSYGCVIIKAKYKKRSVSHEKYCFRGHIVAGRDSAR